MFAGRGHIGVDHRRQDYVDIGSARELPIFGIVISTLDIVEIRADGDRPGQMTADPRPTSQFWRAIQRQIDLPRRAERLAQPELLTFGDDSARVAMLAAWCGLQG